MIPRNDSCLVPVNFQVSPRESAIQSTDGYADKTMSRHPPSEILEEGRPVTKKGGFHFAAPLSAVELEHGKPVKTEWMIRRRWLPLLMLHTAV